MSGWWQTNTESVSTPLTEEMMLKAFESLPDRGPHGSKDNPHIAHPKDPTFCIECGWRKPGVLGKSGARED